MAELSAEKVSVKMPSNVADKLGSFVAPSLEGPVLVSFSDTVGMPDFDIIVSVIEAMVGDTSG